jgi:hypothetical protein
MEQIDLRAKIVDAYRASKTKRSIDPYPRLSFIILAKTKRLIMNPYLVKARVILDPPK